MKNDYKKSFVDVENATGEDYRNLIKIIAKDEVCPFCKENLEKYGNKIIDETDYWLLIEKQNLADGKRNQLVAIPKKHIETIWEIEPGVSADLLKLFSRGAIERGIEGGALVIRFGNTKLSGATIKHLHVELIEPEIGEEVEFHIGHNSKNKILE